MDLSTKKKSAYDIDSLIGNDTSKDDGTCNKRAASPLDRPMSGEHLLKNPNLSPGMPLKMFDNQNIVSVISQY